MTKQQLMAAERVVQKLKAVSPSKFKKLLAVHAKGDIAKMLISSGAISVPDRKNSRYVSKTKYLKELLRNHVTYDVVAESMRYQGSKVPRNLGEVMAAVRRVFWGLYEESRRRTQCPKSSKSV